MSVCSTANTLVVSISGSVYFSPGVLCLNVQVYQSMLSCMRVVDFIHSWKIQLSCRRIHTACVCYLLKSLVELALLEELQDVGLLCLVV